MKHLSKSLEETNKIANDFLETLYPADESCVVALQGDLGTGKTAFAQAVGGILGVAENMHSPTFVIEKIYSIDPAKAEQIGLERFKNLIHIDAYRLEKDSELLHLGWEKIIKEPKNLVLMEWPENVVSLVPEKARRISFKFVNDTTREIEIHE